MCPYSYSFGSLSFERLCSSSTKPWTIAKKRENIFSQQILWMPPVYTRPLVLVYCVVLMVTSKYMTHNVSGFSTLCRSRPSFYTHRPPAMDHSTIIVCVEGTGAFSLLMVPPVPALPLPSLRYALVSMSPFSCPSSSSSSVSLSLPSTISLSPQSGHVSERRHALQHS